MRILSVRAGPQHDDLPLHGARQGRCMARLLEGTTGRLRRRG